MVLRDVNKTLSGKDIRNKYVISFYLLFYGLAFVCYEAEYVDCDSLIQKSDWFTY